MNQRSHQSQTHCSALETISHSVSCRGPEEPGWTTPTIRHWHCSSEPEHWQPDKHSVESPLIGSWLCLSMVLVYICIYSTLSHHPLFLSFFLKKRGWVGTLVQYSTAVTVAPKLNCGWRRKETLSKRKNSAFLHTLQSYSEKLRCMLLVLYSACLSMISAPP